MPWEPRPIACLLVLIPVGVQRPAMAGEAAGVSPLIEAIRADSTGVEGIPEVIAPAHPAILGAGGPSAKRTADVIASATGIAGTEVEFGIGPILNYRCVPLHVHSPSPALTRNDSRESVWTCRLVGRRFETLDLDRTWGRSGNPAPRPFVPSPACRTPNARPG